MVMRLTDNLFAEGMGALYQYAGRVIVLDALVGGADRSNWGNHLFVEGERQWYTIDYALSFNRFMDPRIGDDGRTGTGDPKLPFGSEGWQQEFPELLEAVRLHPDPFRDTIALAESIPFDRIEALVNLPPAEYARPEDREEMICFLKDRQANLRKLLAEWCERSGLPEISRTL